ncbi:hypothetical protein ACMYHA_000571 [Campylobacter jejuni]
MKELGKNIVNNLNIFKKSQCNGKNNPNFYVCSAQDIELIKGDKKYFTIKNSMYNEDVVRIYNNTILKFPQKFQNYNLIALHTWNAFVDHAEGFELKNSYPKIEEFGIANLNIYNKGLSIFKQSNILINVIEIQNIFKIDKNTYIQLNNPNRGN